MAKAVVLAAPCSGSGKTVVTLGLLRALRNRGLRVSSAKVGPDYIDPRFHELATGRPCLNLDPWAMDKSLLQSLLAHQARDADIVLVEGVMGLFDGPAGGKGSTADLAVQLGLPVVLVVDAAHQGQSAAALVHGFASYWPGLKLEGVILNRVASDRHEMILRGALGDRVIGVVRRNDSLSLPSRHLGLVQVEEYQGIDERIEVIASAVSRETILDNLLTISVEVADESDIRAALPPLGQNIAVARDQAFSFLYPHLLQGWRQAGARISFFSPLADEAPDPSADAIFLPGGYPELHVGRIASAGRFLNGLRSAKGLVYGECGGFMVLGDAIVDEKGVSHAMAGLLPLVTSFSKRKLHLGYRRLIPLPGAPWSTPVRGHEFHYSTIACDGAADRLFAAEEASGQTLPDMGLRRGRVMGSYAHVITGEP